MNTLTIPELSLFHNRRSSVHQTDHQYIKYNHTYHARNNYQGKTQFASIKQNRDYYAPPTRGVSTSSRYKQIAEDYLDKRTKSPSYFIDSTPYIHNIPSYLPKAPSKQLSNCRGQCENELRQKKQSDNKNTYFWLDNHRQKQTRILKDPYLQPTFREGKGFLNYEKPTREQKNISKVQNRQQSFVSNTVCDRLSNSKIMQKLKTHQSDEVEQHPKPRDIKKASMHEAQIQTQKVNQSSVVQQKKRYEREKSRPPVEKILQEQKLLIESLKFQIEKESDFKNQVQDLESTKNDYIQKSRELLLKLNQLADDKRQFGFVLKAFADKKKTNVFRDLDF